MKCCVNKVRKKGKGQLKVKGIKDRLGRLKEGREGGKTGGQKVDAACLHFPNTISSA